MKGSKANTIIPQPTTASSANLLTDSTSQVVDPPSKSPFVPVPPTQHSQVGVNASGTTIPKLTMPVQPDPPSVVSPQLVPLHPLPHSTTACRLAQGVHNWERITQDPWILESVKGYKIPFVREPYQW